MLRLSNTFLNLKKAITDRVALDQKHDAKTPRVGPVVFERPTPTAAMDVNPLFTPHLVPMRMPRANSNLEVPLRAKNTARSSLNVPSPLSAYIPSLFSRRNVSTHTDITVPPAASKSPHSPFPNDCDFDCSEGQHTSTDKESDFAVYRRNTERDFGCALCFPSVYEVEAKRSAFCGCVEGPSSSEMEIGVIIPAIDAETEPASFVFGPETVHFSPLVGYLAMETGRPRSDDIFLMSKVYPRLVYNQASFNAWLKWSMGRKSSEDLVLYAL